jgi:N4-gp56 family major capsid protein
MALTNFGLLTAEQKTAWSRTLWKQARNGTFINKFLGDGPTSMIQHIKELKKTEKGARAVLTLLADLVGDGIAGDRTLEGNEEALQTADQVIRIDQLRHASRHEGRMADQKSVVEFRGNARDALAYWMSDRLDQLAFLTLSGVSYAMTNTGKLRIGSDLKNLEFAADVKPITANRRLRWDNSGTVGGGSLVSNAATTDVTALDVPCWNMFMAMKEYAKTRHIRGVGQSGGEEVYHAFLSPGAMLKLKQDPDYIANLRHAQSRGDSNELFTGGSVKIDGIHLHEFRHVYNTREATAGNKWGGGAVDGCQVLFCGAQALGMADIGAPYWDEKGFDYDNQQGIAVGKIMGFLNPQYPTIYEGGSLETFGMMSCYVAQ